MTPIANSCPCKGCARRWVSSDGGRCHSGCQEYQEWKTRSDEILHTIGRGVHEDNVVKNIIFSKRPKK